MGRPNNRTKRLYVITELIYGAFRILEKKDTIRLINMSDAVYKTLLVFKTKAPEDKLLLAAKSKEIWNSVRDMSTHKIYGEELKLLIEYLSSLVKENDHKEFFGISNYSYVDSHKVPIKHKLEILKIVLSIDEELKKEFGIGISTEQVKRFKIKKKVVRDKKKPKEQVVKKPSSKKLKFIKREQERKKRLKSMVSTARDRHKLNTEREENDTKEESD